MDEEKKQSKSFLGSLFKWRMGEEELKNQIENYDTLGFFKSARKLATAFIIGSVILTLILSIIGEVSKEAWIDVVFFLILALFVYKGRKWAIITVMIYWTISKIIQLVNDPGGAVMYIIWWAIFMSVFWQAYQVEKTRASIKKSSMIFCRKCGAKNDSNARFCIRCGEKIISDNRL